MMDGWYKMHRKIIESPIFNNPNALRMWVWMLAKASHKQCSLMVGNQEVNLMPGEFIFGRAMAAAELNVPKSTVYDMLKSIEKMGMVCVKSGNKFSVVTIVNWGFYQGSDNHSSASSRQQTDNKSASSRQQTDNKSASSRQQTDNKSASSRQQTDTNKNVKNNKECKERKEIGASPASSFSSEDDWKVRAGR